MADAAPPLPPVPRKRRLGCWGWGLIVIVVLVVLPLLAFCTVAFLGYEKVGWMQAMTSDTGDVVPQAGDDVNAFTAKVNQAYQQIQLFEVASANNSPASLQLSPDQINALLAHLAFTSELGNIGAIVSMNNDECEAKVSIPSEQIPGSNIKQRYFNLDTTFKISFDASAHRIAIVPVTMGFNVPTPQPVNGEKDSVVPLDASHIPQVTDLINNSLNTALQADSTGKVLLANASSIQIVNGNLVIQSGPTGQ